MTALIYRFGMAFALLAFASGEVKAGYIAPSSVSGTGSFSGSPSVIIDGVLPPRGTVYNGPMSVSWAGTSTYFTVDLGSVYTVANLTADVDNNDDYVIKYSTNGITFTDLFTFLASDGPVGPNPGGLDILTTDSSYPSSVPYPADRTTPEYVGRGFAPVAARYLRISGANGDGLFGVGELDAFTPNNVVPEPSSLILTGMTVLSGLGYWMAKRSGRVVA